MSELVFYARAYCILWIICLSHFIIDNEQLTIRLTLLYYCSIDRYLEVISACGLEPDLQLLPDGDETEVCHLNFLTSSLLNLIYFR